MRVLITGGCGFIGSHTVDILIENGYDVIVIDKLLKKENLNPKAKYIKLDVTSPKLKSIMKKLSVNFLFHFASTVNIRNSFENPIKYVKNNILSTINILDACIACNIKKIIFSSSISVYGEPKYLPVDEKHPTIMPILSDDLKDKSLKVINPYTISKIASELYIQMFNEKYGIDYVILRYANVYGPRQSISSGAVIPSFISKILAKSSPIIYGDGTQTRDFIYVEDVARANLLSINWKNDIYNIGSGKEISIINLFKKIVEISNIEVQPIFLDPKNEIKRIFLSVDKAKKYGWKPKISIEEGIKQTIDYFNSKKSKI